VGLDTPFPDTPLRDLVLKIHLSGLEESIYRSPDVLHELGQSNGIALGRFVADLYLSLELAIPTPLIRESRNLISNRKSTKALREMFTDADSNVRGRLGAKWCGASRI
jgi:hypothetical protein